MLSLKHNFLFIHTSKTGGNSIQSALLDYSEDYLEDLPHSSKSKDFEVRNAHFKSLKKHTTLYDYQQCLGEQKIKTLYKFGCVRNPWERAVSFYFSPHRGGRPWSKKEFIEMITRGDVPQALEMFSSIPPVSSTSLVNSLDYVIRFENLNHDFEKVCKDIGLEGISLSHKNKSKRNIHLDYYDEELVAFIESYYPDDIKLFGYEKPF